MSIGAVREEGGNSDTKWLLRRFVTSAPTLPMDEKKKKIRPYTSVKISDREAGQVDNYIEGLLY